MRDEVSEIDGKVVVKLSGDVDLEHCTVVRGLLLDAVSHGKDLLVDLSALLQTVETLPTFPLRIADLR